ncbi:hypothetical protein AVEN_111958-1 [Araneus ventricosus]|uniref:Uncharacterized protein n=1 Tax=Araneus ventricosus TaxID=182803 RepID=A0A4Y2IBC2_ARAVE|nr:hypothetical protein AVEN_111958-1 [Araneus ventricosus]
MTGMKLGDYVKSIINKILKNKILLISFAYDIQILKTSRPAHLKIAKLFHNKGASSAEKEMGLYIIGYHGMVYIDLRKQPELHAFVGSQCSNVCSYTYSLDTHYLVNKRHFLNPDLVLFDSPPAPSKIKAFHYE